MGVQAAPPSRAAEMQKWSAGSVATEVIAERGCARLAGAIGPAAKHYPRAGRFTTLLRVLGSRKCAHTS